MYYTCAFNKLIIFFILFSSTDDETSCFENQNIFFGDYDIILCDNKTAKKVRQQDVIICTV